MLENDKILGRMSTLNEMYKNIYDTCDDIIGWWICEFPDCPTVLDLYNIAADDKQWDNCWNTFTELMAEWEKIENGD